MRLDGVEHHSRVPQQLIRRNLPLNLSMIRSANYCSLQRPFTVAGYRQYCSQPHVVGSNMYNIPIHGLEVRAKQVLPDRCCCVWSTRIFDTDFQGKSLHKPCTTAASFIVCQEDACLLQCLVSPTKPSNHPPQYLQWIQQHDH